MDTAISKAYSTQHYERTGLRSLLDDTTNILVVYIFTQLCSMLQVPCAIALWRISVSYSVTIRLFYGIHLAQRNSSCCTAMCLITDVIIVKEKCMQEQGSMQR